MDGWMDTMTLHSAVTITALPSDGNSLPRGGILSVLTQ